MTQRIFDIENADDMALLWSILQDNIIKLEKPYMNGYLYPKYVLARSENGEYELPIDINWHDKTEITRPIQEATEADIGKLCYFWDDDDYFYGKLDCILSGRGVRYSLGNGMAFNHCRRLTKTEVSELC